MEKHLFGHMPDGTPIEEFVLSSDSLCAKILTYGATLRVLEYGGRDVIGGYDTLDEYLKDDDPYQGAIIGRVANRIAHGRFDLNGKTYTLAQNNGRHHLHGGVLGFHRRVWKVERTEGESITLSHFSPDGEEGYPANLWVKVTYRVTNDSLSITYDATSDGDTPLNLTNHAFFNLKGMDGGDVFDHVAEISADRYTAVDDELIPTGARPSVAGTPFDFRTAKPIGQDLSSDFPSYDHNFIFANAPIKTVCGQSLPLVARFTGGGIAMEVYTTSPCGQLYTGAFLHGPLCFKGGIPKKKYHAFCFETQKEPDGIHHGDTPLHAGEAYHTVTVYRFR